MSMTFYPQNDDVDKGSLDERIEILMEASERFKATILEFSTKVDEEKIDTKKRMVPREQRAAFNWEAIARILREVREKPEATKGDKLQKAKLLSKLAEIYEVLRGAKMSKLEAVRLALISEANQLRGSSSHIE